MMSRSKLSSNTTGSAPQDERTSTRADQAADALDTKELAKIFAALEKGSGAFRETLQALYQEKGYNLTTEDERYDLTSDGKVDQATYGLLKSLLDDHSGWSRWLGLIETPEFKLSREEALWRLWRSLDERDPAREWIQTYYRSVTYHRHRLFDWLLGRYDLRLARDVWMPKPNRWIAQIHLGLFALIATVIGLRLGPVTPHGWTTAGAWPGALAVGFGYLGAIGFQARAFRQQAESVAQSIAIACQSLIPRLAAASVVGGLMLASSEELLTFVVDTAPNWLWVPLLGAGAGYLVLEMFRRLRPLPSLSRLVRLTLDVATTAMSHSLALVLVAEPGLRLIPDPSFPPLNVWQILNVAAFLFTIGLVVNLIWAEEAATQPL